MGISLIYGETSLNFKFGANSLEFRPRQDYGHAQVCA